ncbi:MAG: flagellar motor protein MotB [Alphaproteobacteria bacterium]|nr:flagellar motor protein MotB [Alphaproteobacteria bacterium]
MSDRRNTDGSIVIKKIKKGEHGHHGGAWKVAYADFVTAMMAFFLLLWLLSATTDDQKKGISEYFTPASVSLSSGGAGGLLGGLALSPGASASASSSAPVIVTIASPPPPQPTKVVEETKGADKEKEAQERFKAQQEQVAFNDAQEALKRAIEEDPEIRDLKNQIIIDMTPEGMPIQLTDKDGGSMFAAGSAQVTPKTRKLLATVAKVMEKLPNKVSIAGHTDASPFNRQGYTNWELSSDRANSSRRVLTENGVIQERMARVIGKAATEPLNEEDPLKPENRRITIVLMREAPVLPPELVKKADGSR